MADKAKIEDSKELDSDLDLSSDEDSGTGMKDSETDPSSPAAVTSNVLLRATINELERALKDTRRLLFERDQENIYLRQELERERAETYKEVQRNKTMALEVEKKQTRISELEKKIDDLNSAIVDLNEKIREKELDNDTDEIIPCCASMNELIQVKKELESKEELLQQLRINNLSISENGKGYLCDSVLKDKQPQMDMQSQVKMKFLKDAFFYYMIDFHSDEQLRAILAILGYDERRREIILESHKKRQQGKRYNVTDVSTRSLTFVQQER